MLGAASLVLVGLLALPALALGQSLVPDLRTNPLPTSGGDPLIDGNELLFSNGWANHGEGPWETAPVGPEENDDCDGDGNASNDVVVEQRTYQDADENEEFERGIDVNTVDTAAGCMVFHPSHNHFHVENAGVYSLLAEPGGKPVGASSKVSFCLLDVGSFDLDLPGAPDDAYYDGCSPTVQGVSVGWYDEYGLFLPGQSINIAGIAAGSYCLRSQFDPLDLFQELDETNNLAEQRYFLDPEGESVTPLSGPCNVASGPGNGSTDVTPPNTKIVRGPKGRTEDRTPRFRFRADELATFECKLDRKRWRPCESPRKFRRRSLRRHRFKVRATDMAGNVEEKPAKRRFRIVRRR